MKKLDKTEQVYQFISSYFTENGYAPTVREICKACSIASTATAFNIMNELAEKGLISKSKVGENKRRAISINQQAVKVPLIGTVAAGEPIFAQENYEDYFSLPANMFNGDDMFMLTVKGNSMIKIGMYNGDKIVVRKQESAENGEAAVRTVVSADKEEAVAESGAASVKEMGKVMAIVTPKVKGRADNKVVGNLVRKMLQGK